MRALFAILALLGVAGIAFGVLTIIRGASGPVAAPFNFENYGGPGPIIAGLMPVTSRNGLVRTAELALGARVPAGLLRGVLRAEDDPAVEEVGVLWATRQAFELFNRQVAGIHFYTLNRSRPTLKIYESLAVNSPRRTV